MLHADIVLHGSMLSFFLLDQLCLITSNFFHALVISSIKVSLLKELLSNFFSCVNLSASCIYIIILIYGMIMLHGKQKVALLKLLSKYFSEL